MRFIFSVLFFALMTFSLSAQGFNNGVSGEKTFTFFDKAGRNQATFFSTTPLEDINGTANGIDGTVSFDVTNIAKTIKGHVKVEVNSMQTGIDLRDSHLKSPNWLDAETHPEIRFELTGMKDVKSEADNKISGTATGKFTLHGVTKEISVPVTFIYLKESEDTKKRAPGDLLGLNSKFNVKLSDYGVQNDIIGNKVAEDIEVTFNVVGTVK